MKHAIRLTWRTSLGQVRTEVLEYVRTSSQNFAGCEYQERRYETQDLILRIGEDDVWRDDFGNPLDVLQEEEDMTEQEAP